MAKHGNNVKNQEVLIVEPKFSLFLQRNNHTLYSVSHSKERQASLHDVTWLSEAMEIGCQIKYDNLGNPRNLLFSNHNMIEYIYAADGTKLRTIHRPASNGFKYVRCF
jgi:hypothetical protein